MATITVTIYTIGCATCGYVATALHQESAKASMLDHLIHSHSGAA